MSFYTEMSRFSAISYCTDKNMSRNIFSTHVNKLVIILNTFSNEFFLAILTDL